MSYLLENKTLTEEDINFHVIKPTLKTWIILVIIFAISIVLSSMVFSIFQTYYLIAPPIIISIIVTPLLYNFLGNKITDLAIVKNFELWKEEDEIGNLLRKIGNFILGIKFHSKSSYFIQADTNDLDLNNIWDVLKSRIFEIIGATIGIAFGILTIIKATPYYPVDPNSQWIIFNSLFFFILLTPLLTFLLVPLIWTAKDAKIRAIDDKAISDMGEELGSSVFSEILGLAGLALGFSYLLDSVRVIYDTIEDPILLYLLALGYLGIFVFLLTGISLLAGIIYLSVYHEKNVNKTRAKLAKIPLPIGVTMVRHAREQEKNLMKLDIDRKTSKKVNK